MVIDVLLGALVLRYAWPMLDKQTALLTILIGVAVILWKAARDF